MMRSSRTRRAPWVATAAALSCAIVLAPVAAQAAIVDAPISYSAEAPAISLAPIGSYETGIFDESAAEIVQAHGDRLFVVNAQAGTVDVLDYSDPKNIVKLYSIASVGVANSVAIRADGLGVIAVEAPVKTDAGQLVFFDATAGSAEAAMLGAVTVGALPDMVSISADGAYAVSANEGEPSEDFTVDPEGSVSIVTLPSAIAVPSQDAVRTADFHAFEPGGTKTLHEDVRVFGPAPHGDDLPVSRNLEPEYIAIDGTTAYAALQEANAVAVVDLAAAEVTAIWPLGFKDHGVAGNGLDTSDKDGMIDIATVEGLKGMYMPDGMNAYSAGGQTYLVTANEGDAREWGDYAESVRVKNLAADGYGGVCENFSALTSDADLGRLNVSIENGFNEASGCYDELYSFGARSFSIWSTDGTQVFDSGDQFERIVAEAAPEFFNSSHSESNFEGRSDDKGPEPENLAIGEVGDRTYAFIGFERVGGVAVFDITDPANSTFVNYINNRDFSISMEDSADPVADLPKAGDLGAEGLAFIPASQSTTGEPLLAVANEVSGTVTLFEIVDPNAPTTTEIQVLTINDFHGRVEANFDNGEAGAAVLSGAVAKFEAENQNTIFASAGDNIGASTFTSFIADDQPTLDALGVAGLDVSAVGNHEFDQGFADLTDRVLGADGYDGDQYGLGANVYLKGTETPALRESFIEEIDGVKVGFIGTVTQDTAAMVSPDGISDIEFGSELDAANRVAADIADETDVIVLLTHNGAAESSCDAVTGTGTDFADLVTNASGEIDAIVSAHTHQSYACKIEGPAGLRPVIQAHQYGTTLGKLDFSVNAGTKELISVSESLVPLVADKAPLFDADPAIASIVTEASKTAEVIGAEQVGKISADILRGGTAGSDRGVESSLGNLVADLYLWATSNANYAGTHAQIGIMNPGGLRADLLYGTDGTMTLRDVANVQPFANTLVTVELTGAQLKSVLEEQWQPDGSSRPKLHLGVSEGFSYVYDNDAPRGERILSMTHLGEPVDAATTYTVVTNSFVSGGGDNFVTFAAGANHTDTGQVDLIATVDYFDAHDVVNPAPFGRAMLSTGGETDPDKLGDWAEVSVGSGTVEQGGTLDVEVSGLTEGQQISATLFSDPLFVTGIPIADAAGNISFSVSIPADFQTGAHRLVVTSAGLAPIEVGVTVTAAATAAGPGAGLGDVLSNTGSALPIGIAALGAVLLLAGATTVLLRRRHQAESM
ncbi:MAG: choice-of-anchor I family protein [Leucobacter sp.]